MINNPEPSVEGQRDVDPACASAVNFLLRRFDHIDRTLERIEMKIDGIRERQADQADRESVELIRDAISEAANERY